MLKKIFLSTFLVIVTVIAAGLSGVSFYLWPTFFNDRPLSVTPGVIQRLRDLQSERKFGPDAASFYPGAPDERQRLVAQKAVDAALASLVSELPKKPQRSTVLRTMKAALQNFDTVESEERDRMLVYLTRAMQICGVESSSELFNVWRYGFPFGWLIR